MSTMKLIGLGLAGLGVVTTGVVGYLGARKIKMQDDAIDRMVATLEDANDMLIKYEDTVKEQAETIQVVKEKLHTVEEENKRLRKQLNEKEKALDTLNYKDIKVNEKTGEVTFEENKEFEEMRKQGKGKTVPYNVFAQPIREQEIDLSKKSKNEPEEKVEETNYSEFIHTDQEVTNIWDNYPSYDIEQGDVTVETVEEEARRIEVSNKFMKEQYDKNGQQALFAYFDMITFPYRNDAEFGMARGVQFANRYGIPFNDGNNYTREKFDYNRFVTKMKELFDYKLELDMVRDKDFGILDDILANRIQFFGRDSIHSHLDQITFGEWIDYAIKRVGYDLYDFNWAVMMDYVMHNIHWYADDLPEDAHKEIMIDVIHHSFVNDYFNKSYGMFRLMKGVDQEWFDADMGFSLRNEWNSFLTRVLDYEAEHEDD